jgi:hypothetical protein
METIWMTTLICLRAFNGCHERVRNRWSAVFAGGRDGGGLGSWEAVEGDSDGEL